ncbi:efflux RND transporter periplasmic adaptor subunit [Neptunitalea lumnitzerae]|uniref:Efflux RND transporter periplasmic adaptor subunit n=1 Tax=Neptunitalea lumnitzerae TaxID=2965509 RepID=A0ABQ5MIT7_9FLAO|nr:efflux RND transporter periplasmic adaptor subunit [Neptunitalea sp. Y10]GLB49303.1 hypothetical protein Y10_16710 [Neptunitalea sp. Y10]
MKKYITYILILLVGLFLGWMLFNNSNTSTSNTHHESTAHKEELWTCSMHPQIVKKEPGDCPICGMELIPLENETSGLSANQLRLSENAVALANIQTTLVGDSLANNAQNILSGTIEANEELNQVQVSYFNGRIEKLYINYTGQTISSGQLLATIYAPELITAQQELLTASKIKESQPKLYKAVKNKLKLWKLTDKQIEHIESSQTIQEYFPIYATVNGTVIDKLVNEGDQIKAGQSLLKISNLNSVWAIFDVYERDLKHIKEGQQITITSNAYPSEEVKAKVDFIDPVLNSNTRTTALRVTLKNNNKKWKPGMFVKASLKTETDETNNINVPASAVLWTGKQSIVYVKTSKNEPIFEMRPVTLGSKVGTSYTILDGLENGEEIVTNGTFTVDAAAQLQGKPSMMTTSVPSKKHTGAMSNMTVERIEESQSFINQLHYVYKAYITLKVNLSEDNFKAAKENGKALSSAVQAAKMKSLKNKNSHPIWMNSKKKLIAALSKFTKASTIEIQREHFLEISKEMIFLVKAFGVEEAAYLQYCPMADNNEGAYWLSNQTEIKNPYFGKSMLTCGSTKDTIH